MGDQYCLLGPYKEQCARTEVEESDFSGPLHTAVSKMREQGFKVRNRRIVGIQILLYGVLLRCSIDKEISL